MNCHMISTVDLQVHGYYFIFYPIKQIIISPSRTIITALDCHIQYNMYRIDEKC